MSPRPRGFTLIELLVVVLVIGILAAIALPRFLGQRTRAKNAAAQSAVRHALVAARSYYTQNSETYVGLGPTQLRGYESSLSGTEAADGQQPGASGANPQDIWIGNGLGSTNPDLVANGDANGGSTVVLCSVSRGDAVYCVKDVNGVTTYLSASSGSVSSAAGGTYSSGGWSSSGGGGCSGTQTYATAGSYSWTAPAGCTSVTVQVWGGGGGAAPGMCGVGGGGGAYSSATVAVTPGSAYSLVVGAGGGGNWCGATSGGDSSFTTAVVAKAGVGGGVYPDRGKGGQASGGVGDVKFSGGDGKIGGWNLNTEDGWGGGGGGSGGSGGAGGNGGTPDIGSPGSGGSGGGGAGGSGGIPSSLDGTDGVAPGGGGGGCGGKQSFPLGYSGNGAAGKVILTW